MGNLTQSVIFRKGFGTVLLFLAVCTSMHAASDHHGRVVAGTVPVPGALVTATQGDKQVTAVTNEDGVYWFRELLDGTWNIQVDITGFSIEKRDTTVGPDAPPVTWDLKILPLSEQKAESTPGFVSSAPTLHPLQITTSFNETAPNVRTDGLLINGSVNNGASTPFALPRAIGNNRKPVRSLYSGAVSFNGSNAVLDARSYSLTGQDTQRSPYSRLLGSMTFGGPLQIPHIFRNGSFAVSYSRSQNRNATLWTA